MIRVFLSYARPDQQRVERLYKNLVAAGFQPWMDVHDIQPGEEWGEAIKRGVKFADCFLSCTSTNSTSKQDGVLVEEQNIALEQWKKKKKWLGRYVVIPVRLEDCQLPASMKHLQWFNLLNDEQWTGLAQAIRTRMKSRNLAVTGAAAAAAVLIGLLIWKAIPADHAEESRTRIDDVRPAERWLPGAVRLGVTAWRLQPADGSVPPGAKILVQPRGQGSGSATEFQPIRAALDKPFRPGDRVRVSFEAAQPGYLYVIDRELRLNGSLGPPRMIFPTKRIGGGRNQILASVPIEIPGQHDDPPFWELEMQDQGYSGERLIVVLAPQPIPGLEPGEDFRDLDELWLRARLTEWQVPLTTSHNSTGTSATAEELAAARPGSKILTHRDPLPQVVFSGEPKAGSPLAAHLDLPFQP